MFQKEIDDAAAVKAIAGESDQDEQVTETPEWAAEGK